MRRFAVLTGAMVLAASSASAQNALPDDGGFDLHLFRHAIDSKGQFTVNGTEVLGHLSSSFGMVVDWGRGLARRATLLEGDQRTLSAPLVDNMFSGVFHANLGLANRLVVGLQLPVHLVSGPGTGGSDARIEPLAGYTAPSAGLAYQGVGSAGLHVKWRLLRSDRDPVGLAVMVQGAFPLASGPSNFAGDPGFSLWPSLALEWAPRRWFRLDVNAGYRHTFGRAGRIVDTTWASPVTAGLGVSFRVAPVLDLVAEAYANSYTNALFATNATPVEAVGGIKLFLQSNSYLLLGAGRRVTNADAAADFRAFIGFVFEPSIGDRDGDGYRDDLDQCPDDPEDFDAFEDQDGCSEPDNDQDGILDRNDQCPNTPEDRDGEQDEDGCPDRDNNDRDGDGILDNVDQCPDVPEDRDNFEDENGCPDPDNDHDRIPDVRDRCPNEPETYNAHEDEDGCPDQGLAVLEENNIRILQAINFETNSAQIRQESLPIIEAVVATLRANPQLTRIQVQGHADERGNDDHNLQLTRDRAASVVRALVERGIEEERLSSAGYGERCPIDPGHNQAAWARNRRSIFLILRTNNGATNVEIVCPAGQDLIPEADRQ